MTNYKLQFNIMSTHSTQVNSVNMYIEINKPHFLYDTNLNTNIKYFADFSPLPIIKNKYLPL